MRQREILPVHNVQALKHTLRAWAQTSPVAIYLDSNRSGEAPSPSSQPYWQRTRWECLLAIGAADAVCSQVGNAFSALRRFCDQHSDWLFGFLSYDLKNEVERLSSRHPDPIGFPDLYFFQPEVVVGIQRRGKDYFAEISTLNGSPRCLLEVAVRQRRLPRRTHASMPVPLRPRMPRDRYITTVHALQEHIAAGDAYEITLCQEFFAEGVSIDPLLTFERLNTLAQAPFSAFVRWHQCYLLCASPERFLAKEGRRLFSQPIKGTRPRLADAQADARMRETLRLSEKDRAENAMIVDLARNDLARHCTPGTVAVEELFGIYSFPVVHQMISTVSGLLAPEAHPVTALRDAFPMGSMTGAPKIRAMELIEQYECSQRGLYSGAVGYFSPEGDFDFNVVIRSILYAASTGYLSCPVGSAIVFDSKPEEEYEECLVKLRAMQESLKYTSTT